MMGEYADMAVDDALNGGHWWPGDYDDDEDVWVGSRRSRFTRRKPRQRSRPALPAIAADFADL